MKKRNPDANCGNCPYWSPDEERDSKNEDDFRTCDRFPNYDENYKYTANYMSCGEHPNFLIDDTTADEELTRAQLSGE